MIAMSAVALVELTAARTGTQSVLDQAVGFVFVPMEAAITTSARAVGDEAYALVHAREFSARNAALEAKVRRLASANERLRGDATENAELRRLLHVTQTAPTRSVAATIVGYAPESTRRLVTIDRGTKSGVRRDCVVVADDGLVGRVVDAGLTQAHVLLVIDPTSAVPAYLQRARAWGIVLGTWQHAKMKYIAQDLRVENGDQAVTGRGQIFPAGIPIGHVRAVERKDNALYQSALLEPSVDFHSLARVVVLLR